MSYIGSLFCMMIISFIGYCTSSVTLKDVYTFNPEHVLTSGLSECCACDAMCLCGLHFSLCFVYLGPPAFLLTGRLELWAWTGSPLVLFVAALCFGPVVLSHSVSVPVKLPWLFHHISHHMWVNLSCLRFQKASAAQRLCKCASSVMHSSAPGRRE